MSWLFGSSKPKLTPKEQVREWSSGLKKEQRTLERERMRIEREETKMKAEMKKLAKSGHNAALKTMAKSLIKSQTVRSRMLEASTRINSVLLTLKTHAATMSVAEHMGKSAAVMKGMQSLVSLPELRATAKSMSQEMMKAGIISEMIDESMESLDPEGIDEEAEEEVDKVIAEITEGTFGQIGTIKGKNTQQQENKEEVSKGEEEEKKEEQ
jgi:charged multivesicular body protein 3